RYRIVFDTSVIGLEPGAQVYLNGIKVGTVDDVDVAASDIAKVAVVIKVKHDAPIHTDTRAILQHAGITGLKTIDLRGGTSATPRLAAGAEIATGTGSVDKLEAQAQAIVDDAAALVRRAAIACGCGGKLPETHYYQLAAADVRLRGGDGIVVLDTLATDAAYDDERIVYRTTPFRLDYYQYHRWSSAPGVMVGNYLE